MRFSSGSRAAASRSGRALAATASRSASAFSSGLVFKNRRRISSPHSINPRLLAVNCCLNHFADRRRMSRKKIDRAGEPLSKQPDVEPQVARVLIDRLFCFGEQIEEQCSQPGLLKLAGYEPIARAMPAAAAAMCEKNNAAGIGRT